MIRKPSHYALAREDLELLIKLAKSLYGTETAEDIPQPTVEPAARAQSIFELADIEVFGVERYATLAEKAAYIFYSFIKNHPLQNGNKRMAVICATTFLLANAVERARVDYSNPAVSFGEVDIFYFYRLTLEVEASLPAEHEAVRARLTQVFDEFLQHLTITDQSPTDSNPQ